MLILFPLLISIRKNGREKKHGDNWNVVTLVVDVFRDNKLEEQSAITFIK